MERFKCSNLRKYYGLRIMLYSLNYVCMFEVRVLLELTQRSQFERFANKLYYQLICSFLHFSPAVALAGGFA